MQNYKEILTKEKEVWFEVAFNDSKKFLTWLKNLNYVWKNGEKINPNEKQRFLHFSVTKNGVLSVVPLSAWCSKKQPFVSIQRNVFNEFC